MSSSTGRTRQLGEGSWSGLIALWRGRGRGRLVLLALSFLGSSRGRCGRWGGLVLWRYGSGWSGGGGLVVFSLSLLGSCGSRRGSWGRLVVLALALLRVLGILDGNPCGDVTGLYTQV